MENIIKIFYELVEFVEKNWVYFLVGLGILVVVLVISLIFFESRKAEERALKDKFDVAYFSYVNSRDSQTLEQSFQNFVSVLQEISETKKDYDIVSIANIILGDIYFNDQRRLLDTALSYYSKSTNSRSEFLRVVALFNVAQTYEEMGMFDNALKFYKVIYENYPKSFLSPMSVSKSAEIYIYLNRVEEAKQMLSIMSNRYSDSEATKIANLIDLLLQSYK
ncbi:MAG: tetratricopeptide repeat protein [Brevinematales bacterium]|nr:tetratricopeptide repeat protein [Brevinematales bacterium]